MSYLIPDIEDAVPLPPSATIAMPELSPAEELAMRARTIKLLSDATGQVLVPTEADQDAAMSIAKEMMQDPAIRPDFAKYNDETMAYLAGMVTQHKVQLVDELSELKMYVVNRLINEVETATSAKDRINALSKLGDIDGVDAFKRRSEVTHVVKPMEEVEKELLSTLEALRISVDDADYAEYTVVEPQNGVSDGV
jgi:hypothetical protein